MKKTFQLKTSWGDEETLMLSYDPKQHYIYLECIDEDGCIEPYADVTKNLPNYPVPDGMVLVKNYSENEGILEALIELGVLSNPVKDISSGMVTLQLCKVLPAINEYL